MGGTGGVQTEAPGLAVRDGRGRRARPHQSAVTEDFYYGQFGLQVGVKNLDMILLKSCTSLHKQIVFRWLLGLKFKGDSKKLDLSVAVKYFRHCVTKSGIDRGWMNEGMVLKADYKKRRHILEDL